MYQTFNLRTPPDQLTDYLQANAVTTGFRLRRRAALARSSEGNWLLLCCTVEALPNAGQSPDAVASRRYPEAVLYEDWLNADECRKFIDEIQNGVATFGDILIERKEENPNWHVELLPLKNDFMVRAGYVASLRFERILVRISQDPLLAPNQPYYPNLAEAVRHWLPFTIYHGDTDARNQAIFFLLPEARAFFLSASGCDGNWQVLIEGTEASKPDLKVTGAYWKDNAMVHFETKVSGGKVTFPLPTYVDRLDYVLMDSRGVVYDFQREDRFNHTGLGTKRLDGAEQDLEQQVKTACLDGEGMQIEFKPFIIPSDGMGTRIKKTKLRELVTTVVAFANTQGGRVYIGVDDDCGVSGIAAELHQWAVKTAIGEDIPERYRGVLTGKIKDQLEGDAFVRVSCATCDDLPVVIVDVQQSAAKPLKVRGDNTFYVRAGASNQQLPPDKWESVLGKKSSDGILQFGTK